MSCEFEPRVSLLIDGALSREQAVEVRAHIEGCPGCGQAVDDYARLGDLLRSIEIETTRPAEQVLESLLAPGRQSVWRRRIAVPLPLLVAAALLLVLLGAWTARLRTRTHPTFLSTERPRVTTLPASIAPGGGIDRFDRGRPAVLYKVRREHE